MILSIFFFFLVILALVLVIVYSFTGQNNETFSPAWHLQTRNFTPDEESETIYLSAYLDENHISSSIEYLNNFGNVIWQCSDKIYALFSTTINRLQNQLLTIKSTANLNMSIDGNVYLLNQFINFPYGIVLDYLDGWSDPNLKLYNAENWTQQYNLIKQPIYSAPAITLSPLLENEKSVKPPDNFSSFIGVITPSNFALPSASCLQQLATLLGYSADTFLSQIYIAIFDPNAKPYPISIQTPVFTSQTLKEMNSAGQELNADLQAILTANPKSKILIYYADTGRFSNPLLPLWISSDMNKEQQNSAPITWTSSIDNRYKVSEQSYNSRCNQMKKLVQYGINTFQCSGDQGNYSSILYNSNTPFELIADITKPDTVSGFFDSNITLFVGGYLRSSQENSSKFNDNVTMIQFTEDYSSLTPTSNIFENAFFASGAGFTRGYYNEPTIKNNIVNTYRRKYNFPLSIKQNPDGIIENFPELSLNFEGNAIPDLVGISGMNLCNGDDSLIPGFGTSIATPFTASLFAQIQDIRISNGKNPLALLETIYAFPQYFNKNIQGRNNFFNLYGFPSDDQLLWDPVQGLGIPNIDILNLINL